MPDSKWGPELEEETKAAAKRMRLYVDAWIATYGSRGFLPRIGRIPSLAISDMARVLTDWEGPYGWAVAAWETVLFADGTSERVVRALRTFLDEEDAVSARHLFGPEAFVARWDDNGVKSCWVPR